jgi:hypothetical protein
MVDKIIFVSVGEDGKSIPHYKVTDSEINESSIKLIDMRMNTY